MENLVETLVEKISSQFSEEARKQINEPKDKIEATLKKIPSVLVGVLISQLSQPNKTSALFKLLTSKDNIAQIQHGSLALITEFSAGTKTTVNEPATNEKPKTTAVSTSETRNLVDNVFTQVFGSNNKAKTFTDQFAKLQGIRPESMDSLFKSATAFSLIQIIKLMRDKGLGVVGFSELLTSQKRYIEQASPDITKLIAMINVPATAVADKKTDKTDNSEKTAGLSSEVTKESTKATEKITVAKDDNNPKTKSGKTETATPTLPEAVSQIKIQEVDLKPPFPMWIFPLLILVGGGWLISQWYTDTAGDKLKTAKVSVTKEANKASNVKGMGSSDKELQERLDKPVVKDQKEDNKQLAMLADATKAKNEPAVKKIDETKIESLTEFAKNSKESTDKDKKEKDSLDNNKLAVNQPAVKIKEESQVKQNEEEKLAQETIAKQVKEKERVKQENEKQKPLEKTPEKKSIETKTKVLAKNNISISRASEASKPKKISAEPTSEILLPIVHKEYKGLKDSQTDGVSGVMATYKLSVTKNGVAEKLYNYLTKNYETIKTLSQQNRQEEKRVKSADLARADLNNAAFIDLPIEVMNFDSIYFNVGTTSLQGGLKDIYQVSKVLEFYDLVRIKLRGHSDSTGAKKSNEKISLARANKIKDKLVTYGIDTNRIFTEGVADAFPLNKNQNEEGRRGNRRVDMRVVE